MERYGLKPLHEPKEPGVDIIFVHGLNGDGLGSWTTKTVLWPKAFLSADIPDARVMAYGYDGNVSHLDASQITASTIESHATKLCALLAADRAEKDAESRPIVFVAHSLGGLVCAQSIIMGHRKQPGDNHHVIAAHTIGMIFFGTPFRGSSAAEYGGIIKKILKVLWGANLGLLSSLSKKSEKLKTLIEAFPDVLRARESAASPVGLMFFVEELKTSLIGEVVVDKDSAIIPGFGDYTPLRADHQSMCKFETKDAEGYKLFLAALKKLLKQAVEGNSKQLQGGSTFNNYDKVINQAHHQTISGQTFNF